MSKNSLPKILIGLLALSAVILIALTVIYVQGVGQMRGLQFRASQIANDQNVLRAMSAEALEYSKSHPDIDPILQAAGLKQNAPDSTSKNGK